MCNHWCGDKCRQWCRCGRWYGLTCEHIGRYWCVNISAGIGVGTGVSTEEDIGVDTSVDIGNWCGHRCRHGGLV